MRHVEKIKASAESAKEQISEQACGLVEKGREHASHLYNDALTTLESAQEQIKKYGNAVSQEVQKDPITFTLLVVGISCLLASIFTRRS